MTGNDTKIQWESLLVERPFCQQLERLGWTWLEGDTDVPELTERQTFREVLLKPRLAAALRKLNPGPDGLPWLDETRIDKAIRQLESTGGIRLMEANRHVTELLIKGTTTEGLPGWDAGRPQPLRYIDFDHPENNDFLVINQFKVALASGRGHIIPDAVLFVNGLPLALAEFKSPGIEAPLAQAIDQLLRYSNQRKMLYPEQYPDDEGVERLFHANQLLIVSNFFEARAATMGAPPEAYLEWADTSPVPLSQVAEEIGLIPREEPLAAAEQEATEAQRAIGTEQANRAGTPLFYREATPAQSKGLSSQHILVAGMLRPAHLLDLIRNFMLFQSVEGKTRKVVARYQQFRAVHKTVERLRTGRSRLRGAERDERGGIIWHTQGSGKSLTMVFLVRKMRALAELGKFKIVVITDRSDLEKQLRETAKLTGETVRPSETDQARRETATTRTQRILAEQSPDIVFAMIQKYQDQEARRGAQQVRMTIAHKEIQVVEAQDGQAPQRKALDKNITFEESIQFQQFPELNDSDQILVLVDEAHRGQSRALHRNMRKALPNAAIVGFTGTPILSKEKIETREIFGDYIDRYLLKDAELDGATVPILYEGRTADGMVKEAKSLDKVFEDMFRGYTPAELAIIKAKYATQGDVLEAPLLIEKKAEDMLRHYVGAILPEGYKAQVVATSRAAAVTYFKKLTQAKDALLAKLETLSPALLALPEPDQDKLDPDTRFLIQTHPYLPMIRALEFSVVISGNHNDPEAWKDWTNKDQQETSVERFKRRLAPEKTDKTDPLGLLVVTNMLLTGFDAPVEQVLYLDRKIVAHDLLQAIARVNRTYGRKPRGYVVDYIGVARHLNKALDEYDREDIAGTGLDIHTELPKLRDRHARVMAIFTKRGITDLFGGVQEAVELLADLKIRADFINKLRLFYETLGVLEHRPEVPPEIFRDAKLLGFINKVAANLYRDPTLNLLGVPAKVRALIDKHVAARGVDPKIPPIAITDAGFEKAVAAKSSTQARAAEMQHAARYHISSFHLQNPAYAKKMSEKLEEILKTFKDNWAELEKALKEFINGLKEGDTNEFPGLDPVVEVPFVRLVLEVISKNTVFDTAREQQLIALTLDFVEHIRQEIRRVGFWKSDHRREMLILLCQIRCNGMPGGLMP
jgi:type I restriction enzyme R subunit